ncbi:MAG: hypothetical protein NW201_11320 [Gemmatimonadales bacterium]|nr:hypothetical protein [Gemmatimonadales bacterium]
MAMQVWRRRVRGALGNALVWGAGWCSVGVAGTLAAWLFDQLFVSGPPPFPWREGLGFAARLGVIGTISGAMFSAFIGLFFAGRRLRDISWIRFALAGGVVTALFLPCFIIVARALSGDAPLPLPHLLRNARFGLIFGTAAAGISMLIAQRLGREAARDDADVPPSVEDGFVTTLAAERVARQPQGRRLAGFRLRP